MSRFGFGTFKNKKEVEYVLQTGCDYLQWILKDYEGENLDKVAEDIERLRKVLYKEGRDMLSMTNKVKYERRINNLEKKLLKLFNK